MIEAEKKRSAEFWQTFGALTTAQQQQITAFMYGTMNVSGRHGAVMEYIEEVKVQPD